MSGAGSRPSAATTKARKPFLSSASVYKSLVVRTPSSANREVDFAWSPRPEQSAKNRESNVAIHSSGVFVCEPKPTIAMFRKRMKR